MKKPKYVTKSKIAQKPIPFCSLPSASCLIILINFNADLLKFVRIQVKFKLTIDFTKTNQTLPLSYLYGFTEVMHRTALRAKRHNLKVKSNI